MGTGCQWRQLRPSTDRWQGSVDNSSSIRCADACIKCELSSREDTQTSKDGLEASRLLVFVVAHHVQHRPLL